MTDFIPLMDFIPELSPRYAAPRHLRPLVDVFERIAAGEVVRVVVDVPPRFAKTETILHAIPWLLLQRPDLQLMYASYGGRLAEKKSRKARELSRRAGVSLDPDASARADWRTGVADGGVWAAGLGGQFTGEGADLLIVDDIIKGRAEAESTTARDRAWMWFLSDAMSRLEPEGSVLLVHTRWHRDDPIGRALALGWEHVHLPAITAQGESLWPERWPLERLIEKRDLLGGENGYEWMSLYQGEPLASEGRKFQGVAFYDESEISEISKASIGIGLDFAYSTKTSSDFSVAVVLARLGGRYFVLDVIRAREDATEFRERLRGLGQRFPRAKCFTYIGGTESITIKFMREAGIRIASAPASVNKVTRALPVSSAWNTGRIRVPRDAAWVDAFVSELCSFTGVGDRHDDQVDAFAAAFDVISPARGSLTIYAGSSERHELPGVRVYGSRDDINEIMADRRRRFFNDEKNR